VRSELPSVAANRLRNFGALGAGGMGQVTLTKLHGRRLARKWAHRGNMAWEASMLSKAQGHGVIQLLAIVRNDPG
jgi:hypothetical protein